ncbi:MAG: SCO family protein [Gemmatimonadetes bacterium]|jgi:protein SCO1|nr:SCO family protein [Gemmatimonadota bacterium]MBT6147686.1 SCO family protein [Gemmatimonadota bacterium]MBT7861433.1 SCO family protein [Gemmatimonadota bacterium]
MSTRRSYSLLLTLLSLACAQLSSGQPLGRPLTAGQPLNDTLVNGIEIAQNLDGQVPLDLTFRDDSGNEVRLDQLVRDRPVVLSLVYYECPMLCTQVLNGLLRTLRVVDFDIGNEFDVITVSIDPGETAELAQGKKREYVGGYDRDGAGAGWHFLTGTQASIDSLADAVGFRYQYDAVSDNYIHASGIMVLTPEGRIAQYFYGIEYSPKDMRLALVEASQHQIGNPVDQLILLCYQYDPTTGKYGLVIINTLRIAGGVTVAILAALVIGMIRRERRQRTIAHAHPSPSAPYRNSEQGAQGPTQ